MVLRKLIEELKDFIRDFGEFMKLDHQKIIDYYVESTEFPKDSFDKFDLLVSSSDRIKQTIISFRDSVNNFYFFELIESFESCVHVLDLISNYSKWYQSTSINGRYKATTEIDFVLKQNETLEAFSSRMGFADDEKGFLQLSLRNHIKETDYNLEGGLVLKSPTEIERSSLRLNTVIDELVGEDILGRDIQVKLSFLDNDIVSLSPKETFEQMVKLICSLFKGNNPEFPNDGIDKAFLSNKNRLCTMLPTVIRQLRNIVDGEDTIRDFSIRSIDNRGDIMKVEFEFKSILNDKVKQVVDGN